ARTRPAAPAGDHRPAPWVRTRLRTQPLAALLTAALAFALVFLAAAFPRALDRGADAALRDFLHDRGPLETSLTSTASAPLGDRGESAADLERVAAELLATTGPGYSVAPSGPVFGAQALQRRALADPGLDRPDGRSNPTLHLLYLHGLTEHTTLVAGAWPGPSAPGEPIPIAVSRAAADTIGIRLGDVLQDDSATPLQVRVSGLYTVTDQAEPYWSDLPCTGRACLERSLTDPNTRFWHTAGIVGGDDLRTLAAWGGRPARDFWRLPVDTGALRADRLPEAQRGLASHLTGPAAARLSAATARPDLTTVSRLPGHLAQAAARQGAVAPLAAIGPAAVAGIAAIVLALAAALTTERRGAELRLLRARGASATGVLLRLCGEAAVPVLPAAAAATALALWLLPTPRWTAAVTAALATTLLALFTVPVRAALPPGQDRHRGRAARRVRLSAETAVLALTAAAVAGERRRGAAPPGDGPDLLLVAAPLLIALTAALLLARLLPLLAAAAARAAARSPALVGFLGLARAARGTGGRPRPSTLPLFALVLAVTTAGFGSTVLDGVGLARRQAARLTVGADASAAAPAGRTLPPGFGPAAAALPGVEAATTVRLESEAFLLEGVPRVGTGVDPHATQVTLVVAEPQAYARIARTVGTGTFDPAALAAPPAPATATAASAVPALFSADLARHLGPGSHRLRLPSGGEVLAGIAGAVDATPALPGATRPFIVLPTPAATAVLPELARATDWFAVGRIDEPALAALVRQLPPSDLADPDAPPTAGPTASAAVVGNDPDALRNGYLTRTSAAVTADLARDPLQHAAARFFQHAVTAAGALALLAVLLTLLRAAPDRAALLARLRTMGLRSRQGLALILAETLPQTLTAAAGGALAALAAVALLGPAVDLSALVGSPVPAGLRPAAGPLVRPAAALAALAALAVLAEALTGGRRQVTTHLRAGDHP
ncbi:hypothetical protein, partial [Streptomyces sp. CB01881]|uniref:hypothetical protein n=1 Tax=Streptomyces sp. CB01881 TaxID=2078691 RepID=UPI001883BC0F